MNKPQVILLAAGINSRFFPLNTLPHKSFFTLLGKTLIERALENLSKHNFKQIIIVISPKYRDHELIKNIIEKPNFSKLEIKVIYQQEAKGQGDGLLQAREQITGDVILASPYYTRVGQIGDLLLKTKVETKADCVFLGTQTKTPELYGIIETQGSKVTAVIEKPTLQQTQSNIRLNSIYLLDQKFLKVLANVKPKHYSLELAFNTFAHTNHISWLKQEEALPSLKYSWQVFDFQKNLFDQLSSHIPSKILESKNIIIDESTGPVYIDQSAQIGDFVKIKGPSYIGENVKIGDFSFIRASSIEKGVVVGSNTEIVRSILGINSSIHFSYLADSILAEKTKVGAGLITANKRFDRQAIKVMINDKLINSKRTSLGLITGNNTIIGVRVTSNPGTLIKSQLIIQPGSLIKHTVDK